MSKQALMNNYIKSLAARGVIAYRQLYGFEAEAYVILENSHGVSAVILTCDGSVVHEYTEANAPANVVNANAKFISKLPPPPSNAAAEWRAACVKRQTLRRAAEKQRLASKSASRSTPGSSSTRKSPSTRSSLHANPELVKKLTTAINTARNYASTAYRYYSPAYSNQLLVTISNGNTVNERVQMVDGAAVVKLSIPESFIKIRSMNVLIDDVTSAVTRTVPGCELASSTTYRYIKLAIEEHRELIRSDSLKPIWNNVVY